MHKTRHLPLQAGQALLVVILVMVVALTVGLSIATRSITNTRLSTDDENSKRAFSAAEAGVQEALKAGSTATTLQGQTLGNNSQYKNVSINAISGTSFFLENGATISQDDGADIWFVHHDPTTGVPILTTPLASTQVWIYFGNSGNATCNDPSKEPALEAILVAGASINQATSKHIVYDPCPTRSSVNNMTTPSQAATGTVAFYPGPWTVTNPSTGTNMSMDYVMVVNVTNGYFMRVVPLYANSVILVGSAGVALPEQGNTISSTGVYGSVQRKITAFRSFAKVPPEFFPNIIFSSQ